MKLLLMWLVVIFALASGYLWIRSARANVLASDKTAGYGALMGGELVAQGPKGERIDLHATLVEQSRWNQLAAYCAAASATAQALQSYLFPS